VIALRIVCTGAAAAAATAAALLERPGVFAILGSCGLVLFVCGSGLTVSDAIPFRRGAFAGSLACALAGPLLVVRPTTVVAVAAGTAAALGQLAVLGAAIRSRSAGTTSAAT
jgi:hypothetical protein